MYIAIVVYVCICIHVAIVAHSVSYFGRHSSHGLGYILHNTHDSFIHKRPNKQYRVSLKNTTLIKIFKQALAARRFLFVQRVAII